MSTLTAENVLRLIEELPPAEQSKLNQLLKTRATIQPAKQLDQRVPAKPIPDSSREREWLTKHRREYANQWVALDGDRLIAASKDHDEVWAAAEADGAELPLITFIENPDNITTIIWT